MDALIVADRVGLRQLAGSAINPTVNASALDRVGGLGSLSLDPFEIAVTGPVVLGRDSHQGGGLFMVRN